jgi:hypothetical protein
MGDFGGPTEDFGGRGGGGNHGGRGGGGRSASRRDHAVPHRVPLADDAVAERGGGTSRGDHPAVDVAEDAELVGTFLHSFALLPDHEVLP